MSTLRTIRVLIRLLPSIIALRRDRKKWVDKKKGRVDPAKFQKHARKMLDTFISLGPVYIKLGQWLSSRADILPQPYLVELAKLQDRVPAAPFDLIRPVIERDLGPISEKFDEIDPSPISGASLGQVYRGTSAGRQMAIKVKRPGIENIVAMDIEVLKKVLPMALRFVDPALRYSAKAMLAQFIETIHEEMDYTNESANLKRIRRDMRNNARVVVPSVYEDLSSKNVLTMEYLPGIKITDIESLEEKGIDRKALVIDVHKIFFTMLLRYSVFHADPHPGNISVTDDGKLILYDYGMVGRLNNETRLRLVRLYLALVEKDPARTVSAMDDLGMLTPDSNKMIIEKGIELTISAMHGKKPDDMEVESLMELANRTMSKFPFVLPKNLALYMRMASIIEGIYKTHKVDFKFVKVVREILQEESLIKDAYIEEIKHSFERLAKSIDATISLAPELKMFLDENKALRLNARSKTDTLIPGSILSAAVFLGSAVLYTTDAVLGAAGMVSSLIIMGVFAAFRR